MNHRYF